MPLANNDAASWDNVQVIITKFNDDSWPGVEQKGR